MTTPKKQLKKEREIKGWIYKGFAEKGWKGNDSAVFFYRKMGKSSRYNTFIPVKIIIKLI